MNRDTLLWISILAPPVVWFLCMEANFALAPWACAFGWKAILLLISVLGLVITASLTFLAWGQWKSLGREWPGDAGGAIPRARIMAILGGLIAAFSFLVILAQSVPAVLMGACQ
ncbi:MAG TPA: hypothetical protein VG345_12190 [Bryobacteraceae bacterium]|nr:hypothetical protein [Bryobacteraceae bacterium]